MRKYAKSLIYTGYMEIKNISMKTENITKYVCAFKTLDVIQGVSA